MSRMSAILRPDEGSPEPRRLVPLLLDWFVKDARDLPWRRALDPYAIWVSEVMLQQTQVKTVLPFWERWMRELPDIAAAAGAHPEQLHKLWEGLGYYTRVRNLQKAAQQIMQHHGGRFPESFDDILALPGIGRYTAGAISSIAFNRPTPIVDGNVVRVLTRLFGIGGDPGEKRISDRLWQIAETLVLDASRCSGRARACSHLNQSLMELGALVCTPQAPLCFSCPVKAYCAALQEDRVALLPNLPKRAKPTVLHFAAFAAEWDGKWLVRQRPSGGVNAHLWEFPNVEIPAGMDPASAATSALGFSPETLRPLCRISHAITRYRITLTVFACDTTQSPEAGFGQGLWLTGGELQALSFPSAHKKILKQLPESGSARFFET